MNDYYKSNAVYSALQERRPDRLQWVSGNAWILLYGDAAARARLVALVRGSSWTPSLEVHRIVRWLGAKAGLPTVEVAFDDALPEIDCASLTVDAAPPSVVTLPELTAFFGKLGLPASSSPTRKYLNDRESSAYHKWQRSSLGSSLTVTDLDLIRLGAPGGDPIEVVELKRSVIGLSTWRPYPDDYRNFNLILGVAAKCSIRFSIAYNVRTKSPWRDDASKLVVFQYVAPNLPGPGQQVTFDQFVQGSYL